MGVKFIVFSGIDGSGKTTYSKLVESELRRRNFKTMYVWFRWSSYLSNLLLLFFRFLKYTRRLHIQREGCYKVEVVIREYYKNKFLALLWIFLQSIDMLIRYMLILIRGTHNDIIVICDRFIIPDKLVDLIYETHIVITKVPLIRALLYFFINRIREGKITVIYLSVDPKIALLRKKDIISSSYLLFYSNVYEKLMDFIKASSADNIMVTSTSTHNIDLNFKAIFSYVEDKVLRTK